MTVLGRWNWWAPGRSGACTPGSAPASAGQAVPRTRSARVSLPRMRRIHASLAAVALVALAGTAFAAATRSSVSATMRGTARVAPGGTLELIAVRRGTTRRYRVTIRYDLRVRSRTVLAFAAYPCRSTSCGGYSSSTIGLAAGERHVTFTGRVPVVRRPDGRACVYAQVRDRGPRGRAPGRVVRNGSHKGVSVCRRA